MCGEGRLPSCVWGMPHSDRIGVWSEKTSGQKYGVFFQNGFYAFVLKFAGKEKEMQGFFPQGSNSGKSEPNMFLHDKG